MRGKALVHKSPVKRVCMRDVCAYERLTQRHDRQIERKKKTEEVKRKKRSENLIATD